MTTTYTVTDRSGNVIARGLTLSHAAHEILSTDGREWDIRPIDGGGWRLWSRQQVANRPWAETSITSFVSSPEAASDDIFEQVITACWPGHYEACTDAGYDRMLAEIDA